MAGPMEDDLDDSLLMLAAGGFESGEEDMSAPGSPRSRTQSPPRSRHSSPYRSPSPRSDISDRKSPLSTSDKMPQRSRQAARRSKNDSEEEGEASSVPGSPRSLGSGAMEESDSDASDDEAGKSKPKVSALTGLEREQHLAELAEQENERRRIAQLKGLLSERDRRAEAAKSGKRKASSADLDEDEDDSHATSRRRAKRDEAVQNLRGRLAKRREAKKSSHSRRSSGDLDADGESDYEAPTKVDPPGELAEYQRVRIGRTNFAEVCFYPGFEKYLLGCFTRVCFSLDSVTGENQYRMTQIKGFKTGKPYRIESAQGRAHMCDTYFVAAYGTTEREYPFVACSDSKFSESEFLRWRSTVDKDGANQSTVRELREKVDKINELIHKQWSKAEINKKLEIQSKHDHLLRGGTKQAVGVETLRRDEALQRRNEANRKYNQETIRAALIEEKRRKRDAAIRASQKQKEEDAKKADAATDDLFGEGKEEKEPEKKISLYHQRDYKNNLNSFTKMKTDDEIIGEMDIAIDIEI